MTTNSKEHPEKAEDDKNNGRKRNDAIHASQLVEIGRGYPVCYDRLHADSQISRRNARNLSCEQYTQHAAVASIFIRPCFEIEAGACARKHQLNNELSSMLLLVARRN